MMDHETLRIIAATSLVVGPLCLMAGFFIASAMEDCEGLRNSNKRLADTRGCKQARIDKALAFIASLGRLKGREAAIRDILRGER